MPHESGGYAEECKSQYEESRKWFNENYYGEFDEIYRSVHCRVLALLDSKGREIKNRTNVALPDHFVMQRKKTARLTASPPNLRIRGGSSQEVRDQVSAVSYRQWELGGWQDVLRAMVAQCSMFGWSVDKGWWNRVETYRRLRRRTIDLTRKEYMQQLGAPANEISQAVAELGESLYEGEQAEALIQLGPEVSLPIDTTKYEGPVGQRIFIGDIFPEPGFQSLDQSAWVIEHSEWDIPRLTYWTKVMVTDPDTSQERPAIDPAVVQKMLDETSGVGRDYKKDQELRKRLREAIQQTEPVFNVKLRGKRYDILERHAFQDDGSIVVWWVGEQKYELGYMSYPWDTYGKYIYRDLVLIPDILGGIGMSTLRASRFLMQLRNARMNQTTDFVNLKLRPKMKVLDTADIPETQFERSGWSEVRVKNMEDINPLFDPQFPPEGWQDQAQLVREMQQVEPLINDFQPGTETIPQSGRLATTAVLQQRSADAVTADELRQIDRYLRDRININLAMTQQQMNEPVEIERGNNPRIDALKMFEDGAVRSIMVDPLEIQEDLELIPETGSTLAADDEFRRNSIMQGFALATANPTILDPRPFAAKLAETIPGIKAAEVVLPPPPPPGPEVRIAVSVSVKWPELPGDVQAALLSAGGLPTAGLAAQNALALPEKVNIAAEHALALERPVDETANEETSSKLPKVRTSLSDSKI